MAWLWLQKVVSSKLRLKLPLYSPVKERPNTFLVMVWGSVWREAFFNSRDGNENFFLLISCSRREREFLSLILVLRDENENFLLSISWFETRISFFNLGHRDENGNRDWDNSRVNFRELHFLLVYWQIFSKKYCYSLKISKNNMSFFLEKFE